MAVLGRATDGAARAYANRLCGQGVLIARADETYQVGVLYPGWSAKRPKTRSGGNRLIPYKTIPSDAVLTR